MMILKRGKMHTKRKERQHLKGKDLMTIGIFTAVFLVVYIITACALGLVPLLAILMPCISSIILGIPMMLYFSKIRRFGMILITYTVFGIVMALLGLGVYTLLGVVVFALLAELVLLWGNYQNANKAILAFALLCPAANANTLYWVLASTETLQNRTAELGKEYITTVSGYFELWWVFPLIMFLAFAGGLIGGSLGKIVLRKHFEKSGLV